MLTVQTCSVTDGMQETVADERAIERLRACVTTHEDELMQVQAGAAGAEELVKGIELELENVGGEPMRQQKDLLATIKQVQPASRPSCIEHPQSGTQVLAGRTLADACGCRLTLQVTMRY
jgi:hypothetical protein